MMVDSGAVGDDGMLCSPADYLVVKDVYNGGDMMDVTPTENMGEMDDISPENQVHMYIYI